MSAPCDYRVSWPSLTGWSFCRHSRVFAERNLVHGAICAICQMRDTPADSPRPIPLEVPRPPRRDGPWRYVSIGDLAADVRRSIGKIPPTLSGVAGIPRSGMLPASMLALLLHLPLYELSEASGLRPLGHGGRLVLHRDAERSDLSLAHPLLIVDDAVSSGRAMQQAREILKRQSPLADAIFYAVYVRPETAEQVDVYARLADAPHLFEWNLFNAPLTREFAFDFDGVLCGDWPGGDEEGEEYAAFVASAPPLWLPRRCAVSLIVTARLEKHRPATLAWLARHGVEVDELVMGPWGTTEERRRDDVGRFKAQAYARSASILFVESDEGQAEQIFEVSGKPVLCPAADVVFQD